MLSSSTDPHCGFTLAHYRHCLEQALSQGYRFLTMSSYVEHPPADGKIILMRHDEDLSLPAALRLADLEAELGVRATFFFRFHAQGYNLLALPSLDTLAAVRDQGHEIGLHGETHALGKFAGDGSLLRLERELLSRVLDQEVEGLSLHEPSRTVRGSRATRYTDYGFTYEAYSRQFADLKYISDSSAHWREGCMCQHIGREDRLYILTHGFWWYAQTPLENY